ncbi:MAG: DUF938 domain-containing protein [Myxococcota bacterium]|nr:DUF938 domain-containing protein [Myxococcota bacterium]
MSIKQLSPPPDPRARFSPAAERNLEPIWTEIEPWLPAQGCLLELASGSGQHLAHFALRRPSLTFLPSDPDPSARQSVEAWRAQAAANNLEPPIALDLTCASWSEALPPIDAALAVNLIHIAPWVVTEQLFIGLSQHLPAGAPLFTYGPYRVAGEPFAPSNVAFDASLRARDPRWGVRALDAVQSVAEATGFHLEARTALPANNFLLRWRHRAE